MHWSDQSIYGWGLRVSLKIGGSHWDVVCLYMGKEANA